MSIFRPAHRLLPAASLFLVLALPGAAVWAAPSPRAGEAARRAANPEQTLLLASNYYSYGRYERVVTLLRPLVERGLLRGRGDRLEALRLFGICLFLTKRRAAAVQVFRTLIGLAPGTRLDPRIVQPEVVAAFERVRQPHLRRLRERARRERARQRIQARRELDRRFVILSLIPLAGQLQNGHWKKGVALLTVELALLAANLSSYFLLRSTSLRQPDGTFVEKDADGNVVHDRRGVARALMGINYASLGLLVGAMLYGVVDGLYFHLRRNSQLKRTIERLSRPLAVAPLAAPGGVGVSLSLSF